MLKKYAKCARKSVNVIALQNKNITIDYFWPFMLSHELSNNTILYNILTNYSYGYDGSNDKVQSQL